MRHGSSGRPGQSGEPKKARGRSPWPFLRSSDCPATTCRGDCLRRTPAAGWRPDTRSIVNVQFPEGGMEDATLERLRRASTATITTQLFKRGLRNAFMQDVRPLGRYDGNRVVPAFTLRSIPAREDIDTVGVFTDPDH